ALNNQHPDLYLKHSYKSCVMQFDYFVSTPGSYFIAVRVGTEILDLSTVYTVTHQVETNAWSKAKAHIGPQYSPFFVDIGGFQTDMAGIVALDNIKFVNCSLPSP